jgi:hypothetical protein
MGKGVFEERYKTRSGFQNMIVTAIWTKRRGEERSSGMVAREMRGSCWEQSENKIDRTWKVTRCKINSEVLRNFKRLQDHLFFYNDR